MSESGERQPCNAVDKRGSKVLICDKALDHDLDLPLAQREHQMGFGDDVERWKDRGGW